MSKLDSLILQTGNTVNHNVVNEASTDDDDTPCLSQHTLSALAEFYAERKTSKDENNVEEDWQVLSIFQFFSRFGSWNLLYSRD